MKQLTCPINGTRSIAEFIYGGELRPMPDPQSVDDSIWAAYVFHRDGAPGVKREWWCHSPSNTWFIAERHTVTDEILRTYLYGEEA
ncbi:MAG: sarcosine oxidase subunit delta [Leptolyngbyaceae cyanobacterium SL_7_1]|nr:sarcosine oxidase subunit delta [Leptolyngbyaceae cyanobacterium SL_7_1]